MLIQPISILFAPAAAHDQEHNQDRSHKPPRLKNWQALTPCHKLQPRVSHATAAAPDLNIGLHRPSRTINHTTITGWLQGLVLGRFSELNAPSESLTELTFVLFTL